eukprot:gene57409-biopygen111629
MQAEYAVRGSIVIESERIAAELLANPGAYPFERLIACNIGNPQELLQKPITTESEIGIVFIKRLYNRQVLSMVDNPSLIDVAGNVGCVWQSSFGCTLIGFANPARSRLRCRTPRTLLTARRR